MTPEENREVAKAILKAVDKADLSPNGDPVGAIAQALAAREAETVERCAKVAEGVPCKCGFDIGWALRATLKPETKGEPR